MKQIQPFDANSVSVQKNINRIMIAATLRNLTYKEIVTTLRMLDLHKELSVNDYGEVVVHRNDKRLELLPDEDKFLALLIDCDKREVLLGTKRCRSCFGGTVYHWRNIARKCAITSVASAISECGSGYYGRGWEIAPHICTLRKWIIEHIEEYKYMRE